MNELSTVQQVGIVRPWRDDDHQYAGHLIESATRAWERYRDLAGQLNRNKIALEVLTKVHAEAVEATNLLLATIGQPGESLFIH